MTGVGLSRRGNVSAQWGVFIWLIATAATRVNCDDDSFNEDRIHSENDVTLGQSVKYITPGGTVRDIDGHGSNVLRFNAVKLNKFNGDNARFRPSRLFRPGEIDGRRAGENVGISLGVRRVNERRLSRTYTRVTKRFIKSLIHEPHRGKRDVISKEVSGTIRRFNSSQRSTPNITEYLSSTKHSLRVSRSLYTLSTAVIGRRSSPVVSVSSTAEDSVTVEQNYSESSESRSTVKSGESRSTVKSGESRSTVKSGESRSTVKSEESKSTVKSVESRSTLKSGESGDTTSSPARKTTQIFVDTLDPADHSSNLNNETVQSRVTSSEIISETTNDPAPIYGVSPTPEKSPETTDQIHDRLTETSPIKSVATQSHLNNTVINTQNITIPKIFHSKFFSTSTTETTDQIHNSVTTQSHLNNTIIHTHHTTIAKTVHSKFFTEISNTTDSVKPDQSTIPPLSGYSTTSNAVNDVDNFTATTVYVPHGLTAASSSELIDYLTSTARRQNQYNYTKPLLNTTIGSKYASTDKINTVIVKTSPGSPSATLAVNETASPGEIENNRNNVTDGLSTTGKFTNLRHTNVTVPVRLVFTNVTTSQFHPTAARFSNVTEQPTLNPTNTSSTRHTPVSKTSISVSSRSTVNQGLSDNGTVAVTSVSPGNTSSSELVTINESNNRTSQTTRSHGTITRGSATTEDTINTTTETNSSTSDKLYYRTRQRTTVYTRIFPKNRTTTARKLTSNLQTTNNVARYSTENVNQSSDLSPGLDTTSPTISETTATIKTISLSSVFINKISQATKLSSIRTDSTTHLSSVIVETTSATPVSEYITKTITRDKTSEIVPDTTKPLVVTSTESVTPTEVPSTTAVYGSRSVSTKLKTKMVSLSKLNRTSALSTSTTWRDLVTSMAQQRTSPERSSPEWTSPGRVTSGQTSPEYTHSQFASSVSASRHSTAEFVSSEPGTTETHPKAPAEPEGMAFSEPIPDWEVAKKVWREAWEFHIYFIGVLFAFLALYTFVSIVRLWRMKHLLSRPYFVSMNSLICVFATVRVLYLCIDGYNSNSLLPATVNYFLYSIGFPCITSTYSLLFYSLLQATQLQLMSPRIQRVSFLITIILIHFVISLTTDFVVGFFYSAKVMLILCEVVSILWGCFLIVGFFYICRMIYASARKRQAIVEQLSSLHRNSYMLYDRKVKVPKYTLSLAVKVTFATTIFGVVYVGLHVYGLIDVNNIYSYHRPAPWPWWCYHFSLRLIELIMCSSMAFIATQPFRYLTSEKRSSCFCYLPCRNIFCPEQNDDNVQSIHWHKLDKNLIYKSSTKQTTNNDNYADVKFTHKSFFLPEISRLNNDISKQPSNIYNDNGQMNLGADESESRPSSMLIIENGYIRFRSNAELMEEVKMNLPQADDIKTVKFRALTPDMKHHSRDQPIYFNVQNNGFVVDIGANESGFKPTSNAAYPTFQPDVESRGGASLHGSVISFAPIVADFSVSIENELQRRMNDSADWELTKSNTSVQSGSTGDSDGQAEPRVSVKTDISSPEESDHYVTKPPPKETLVNKLSNLSLKSRCSSNRRYSLVRCYSDNPYRTKNIRTRDRSNTRYYSLTDLQGGDRGSDSDASSSERVSDDGLYERYRLERRGEDAGYHDDGCDDWGYVDSAQSWDDAYIENSAC